MPTSNRCTLAFALLTSLALTLTASGCADSQTLPDCSAIDCGAHGTCDLGACVCDPGYQPTHSGLNCVPFELDDCEGIQCSGLGSCSVEPTGPFGLDQPVCICTAPALVTEDGLDCADPCLGLDCGPGTCKALSAEEATCTCPAGYELDLLQATCVEKTRFAWNLIYDPQGGAWDLGYAWLNVRKTAAGHQLEAGSEYHIPISYNGELAGIVLTVARYDIQGALVEIVQDHQAVFGTHKARRRIHLTAEGLGTENALMNFTSHVLDTIWHGQIQIGTQLPVPMVDAMEYPVFSYGCFDPFFFFALRDRLDPESTVEQQIRVLAPNFVAPFDLQARLEASPNGFVAHLDRYGASATYESGKLTSVDYGWAAWLPTDPGGILEVNLQPLPNQPTEHEAETLPAWTDEPALVQGQDGATLAGSLALPESTPDTTAILLVPDLMPRGRDNGLIYMRTYRDLAARLAEAGYASLRLDDRGVGESEGDMLAAPGLLASDLDAAVGHLLADARFDRVVLVAHGFASPRALALAARQPVAGLVLIAPCGDDLVADIYHKNRDVWLRGGHEQETIDSWYADFAAQMQALADGDSQIDTLERSAAFWFDWLNRDHPQVGGLSAPVLLLRGTEDMVLPIENLDVLEQALLAVGNPPQVVELQGLSHVLTPADMDNLWEEIHLPHTVSSQATQALIEWLTALSD